MHKQESNNEINKFNDDDANDIQFSDISYKKRDNFYNDFLKLKRDLKEKKNQKKRKNENFFNNHDIEHGTNLSILSQNLKDKNMLQYKTFHNKFDEMKNYFEYISPNMNNHSNMWPPEMEMEMNNVFNEVDFLNTDSEKQRLSLLQSNDNVDNFFSLNVHNQEIHYEANIFI